MRNRELEVQIARSPDDPALYAVYADWLTERGDPRGELISVELALEAEPRHPMLHERRAALHGTHDAAWLGPLRVSNRVGVEWRRGFVERITLGDTRARFRERTPTHDELYAALRELPAAALVRDLTFSHIDQDREPTWEPCVAALVRYGVPASLRSLAFDTGYHWALSATRLGDLSPAYPQLAGLASLSIRLGALELGALELPALRELDVASSSLSSANLASIAHARCRGLERLRLAIAINPDRAAEGTLADLVPLLRGDFPSLRELAIQYAAFADALVPHLATSRLLPQLEVLDLSYGGFSDAGARALLEHADAFRHLHHLAIGESDVSSDLVAALAALIPEVSAY